MSVRPSSRPVIVAGIQLRPSALAAFDALGVGEQARAGVVCTDKWVMPDAIDESLVGRIEVLTSTPELRVEQTGRLVRNEMWKGRAPERFCDALEWLHGWRVGNCLAA